MKKATTNKQTRWSAILIGLVFACFIHTTVSASSVIAAVGIYVQAEQERPISQLYVSERDTKTPLVSLHVENMLLIDVLHKLAEELKIDISIHTNQINTHTVSYSGNNIYVYDVLHDLLESTNLEVTLGDNNKTLIVFEKEESLTDFFQGTITGRVTDAATGEPLTGATLFIAELETGAATDTDGYYSIPDIPEGTYSVRINYIGYRQLERSIEIISGDDAEINFQLRRDVLGLDEIVVTGPGGGQERRAIGSTISSVDASDAVERFSIPSVQDLINSRAPGVVIMPGSGMVGGGSKIRIRGSSSINLSNDPIIYVDGIRVDNSQSSGPAVQGFESNVINRLNDFNPDDIESIEILKGAAAATLYGTDASNGVIQITTKRGQVGAPQFSFTNRAGVNFFANKENRMYTNYWTFPDGRVESINLVRSERERGTPIFEPGALHGHNLNVTGGSELARYYLSIDYENEDGIEPTNNMNRFGTRANITIHPADGLDVTANFGYINARYSLLREAGTGGVSWGAQFSTPNHHADFNNNPDEIRRGYRSHLSETYYEFDDFQDLNRFTSSLQVNYIPTEYWTNRLNVGLDIVGEDNRTILENSPIYQIQNPTSLGSITVNQRDVSSITVDYSGTLRFPLSDNITSRTSYGFQYYKNHTSTITAVGEDFPTPGLRSVRSAARTSSDETFWETVSLGMFAEQQIGLNDRMFFTVGLRADDNSAFGENFEIVLYPKAAYTWVISEESFFDIPFISSLRLRAAFGATGQAPGPFDHFRTYAPVTGINDQPVLTPGALGNPDLKPERTQELDIGFEGSFLNDRISAELSYYHATTSDAILFRPVAPSSGFARVVGDRPINIGETQNWGWEFSLNTIPIQNRNIAWNVNFSFSTNDSKIIDLGEEDEIILSSPTSGFGVLHRVGMPLGAFYHIKLVDAALHSDGSTNYASLQCATPDGGSAPCYDVSDPNNPSLIAEPVFIGPGIPKFEGAIASSIMLRNQVQLSATIDYKLGHYKYDNTSRVRGAFGITKEQHLPLESDPIDVVGYRNNYTFSGSQHINDASFARLREVSLSWFIPETFTEQFGIRRATFTVAGRNLYTWTSYSGLDPETMFLGGARGGFVQLDQNSLPQLTQIVGTLNIRF